MFDRCRGKLEPRGFRFATATLPLPWPSRAREAMHADLRPLVRPLNVLEPDGGVMMVREASVATR